MSGKRDKLIRQKVDQQAGRHAELFISGLAKRSLWQRIVFSFNMIIGNLDAKPDNPKFEQIRRRYMRQFIQ